MENKPINSNLLVTLDADSLYQLFLVTDCRQRRHEPAVAIVALPHIICSRAVYEELRGFKDVLSWISAMRLLAEDSGTNIPRLFLPTWAGTRIAPCLDSSNSQVVFQEMLVIF